MSDPRRGSIRAKGANGEWFEAAPGDAFYSSVTMSATEWWNGRKWERIIPEQTEPGIWPLVYGIDRTSDRIVGALNDLNERLSKLEAG